MDPELAATLVSGLVGAFIGGGLTAWASLHVAKQERTAAATRALDQHEEERRRDAREVRRVAYFDLLRAFEDFGRAKGEGESALEKELRGAQLAATKASLVAPQYVRDSIERAGRSAVRLVTHPRDPKSPMNENDHNELWAELISETDLAMMDMAEDMRSDLDIEPVQLAEHPRPEPFDPDAGVDLWDDPVDQRTRWQSW